ncbi:MAG TPA: tetratricopeptide repeat protein [Tahibacter sp.]|nr:tetratricopeptide repeat protein [Tahibacter sp.]
MKTLAWLLLSLVAITPPSWEDLNDRARTAYREQRYDDAAALMRDALALAEKQYGPDDANVAQNLNNLALVYTAQRRYADAEQLYRRAVAIADRTLPEDDPKRVKSVRDLAQMYVAAERWKDAEPLLLRVIEWQQRHAGVASAEVSDTEQQLATVYAKLGRASDADRLSRRSFASIAAPAREQGLVPRASGTYDDWHKGAATIVDIADHRFEALIDRCLSIARDDEYRYTLYLWKAANLDVTLPAAKVLATLPAAQRQALARQADPGPLPDAAPNARTCDLISRETRKGRSDFSETHAKPAQILRTLFAADDKLRIAKRDADFSVGCVKRLYNDGRRDFAAVQSLCECRTRALKASATDGEIDAWLAELAQATQDHPEEKGRTAYAQAAGTTLHHDWLQKALEAGDACDAPVVGGTTR